MINGIGGLLQGYTLASGISVVIEMDDTGWGHRHMCPVLCLAGECLGSRLRTVELMYGGGCSPAGHLL